MLGVSPPVQLFRGPGRWKLNSSILWDLDFSSNIESFWASWRRRKKDLGRAVVLNSLALSRIWFAASVVAMPQGTKHPYFYFFFSGQVKRTVSPERYFTTLSHKAVFG